MLLRRADGTVEELGKGVGGFPLGIVPDTTYDHVEVELRPGDVAVVYSDGVTDARSESEELYDIQSNRRLLNRIRIRPAAPRPLATPSFKRSVRSPAGHVQADDITLVCFGPTVG